MATWTADQLSRLDDTDEMHIAGRRPDGTLRTPRIVWMVRLGDDLYTRSVNGPEAAWFRGVKAQHAGHVSADGIEEDVTFLDIDTDDPVQKDLDSAYRSKYRRYSGPVDSITASLARSATLKIVPAQHR